MFDIQDKARQVTKRASMQKSLHSLSSQVETIHEQEFTFTLRIATNLQKKNSENTEQSARKNPFLPYETELFVANLGERHACILNKYNVLPEHLLIITKEFESQENALSQDDFIALMMIMAESGGLGFFNGGKVAGASQPHKHLQWLPYESQQFPLLNHTNLPFNHGDHPFCPGDADSCYQAYLALSKQFEWYSGQAYNLLVMPDRMRWIPRHRAEVDGISINSLGFAGSFFVADRQRADALLATGLMNALCQVSTG